LRKAILKVPKSEFAHF